MNDAPVLSNPLTDCSDNDDDNEELDYTPDCELYTDFCNIQVNDVEFCEDGFITITVSATDADNEPLTYSCNNDMHPEILCDIDGDQITISSIPHYYNDGEAYITIIVDDGQGEDNSQDLQDILVHVVAVNDPPELSVIDPQELEEDNTKTFSIEAIDYDPEDSLNFSCIGSENIDCEVQNSGPYLNNSEALPIIGASVLLTPTNNFYGTETITVIANDGFIEDIDQANVEITVTPVNDDPKIKQVSYSINAIESEFSNPNDNSVEFNEGEQFSIIFKVSEVDSLDNPDELIITYESLGLDNPDGNENINFDFCNFDTSIDCAFIANDDNLNETDANNIYTCALNCNENFNAEFSGRFAIDDDLDENVIDGQVIEEDIITDIHIKINQVNDLVGPITLNNNISTYSDDIPIEDLNGEETVNSSIFADKTKFFENTTLKTPNVIPDVFNVENIYSYIDAIPEVEPSFYFIWDREESPYQIDVDTDPQINEHPYNLYYRLELVEGNNVYVINDNIADASFAGNYGYTLGVLHPDSSYSYYSNGNLYILCSLSQ